MSVHPFQFFAYKILFYTQNVATYLAGKFQFNICGVNKQNIFTESLSRHYWTNYSNLFNLMAK